LEAELARRCQVPEVVACANGTDALQLALRALGVGEGDLVLIPDATFWATFEAVVNCGARPVTVDIDPEDLQLDLGLLEEAINRFRPAAAILVHLYGWGSAKLDEIRDLCRRQGVALVEDGAQAFGVEWKGESLYRGATVSTISFYPAKVLGACGDAGAVCCSTPELAARIRQLGNHGRAGHYDHPVVGWNSRMGGFEAAYLNLSLEYLDDRLVSRRRLAQRYRESLTRLGLPICGPPIGYLENGYLNVCLPSPEEREPLAARLQEKGIGCGRVYPGSMSKQSGAADWLAGQVGGEVAERLSQTVLNLPLFAYMRDEEQEEVLVAVAEALAG
ncbi:MAG: DegT/DnrJ/EryC1/StrS family aminotransferase, partial [Acidobacteria bacterium]|nr:DegT/DnrJ/EryC1/StrS family aminotransferase [Acidobacteriota bacterium]